ncbi:hypothetical protein, partial [Xylella fastidiosa]|uniref:hypothetical protein n=1 Tax=Xylella fastidiosa TaxID=2371 RepID=UPI00235E3A80
MLVWLSSVLGLSRLEALSAHVVVKNVDMAPSICIKCLALPNLSVNVFKVMLGFTRPAMNPNPSPVITMRSGV